MNHMLFYSAASGAAAVQALRSLETLGIATIDHPAPEITHLLLDIPSFTSDGLLRNGTDIGHILERIPPDVTVIGGNLHHPALQDYRILDLLADEEFLIQNAAITADCAVRLAAPLLRTIFPETPTLVIGWGRIGKCLARLLRSMAIPVTVATRNPKDRAMLTALGYRAVDTTSIPPSFRLVFNTVPHPISLPAMQDCTKIDLASSQGLAGEHVISARGLPGRLAPESTGTLIAQQILRLCREESI